MPEIGVEFGYTEAPIAELKPDRLIVETHAPPGALRSLALHLLK